MLLESVHDIANGEPRRPRTKDSSIMATTRITMKSAQTLISLVSRGICDDFGAAMAQGFESNLTAIALVEDGTLVLGFDDNWTPPPHLEIDRRMELIQREMSIFPFADPVLIHALHGLWKFWADSRRTLGPNRITGHRIVDALSDSIAEAIKLYGSNPAAKIHKIKTIISLFEDQGLLFKINPSLDPETKDELYHVWAVNGQLCNDLLHRPMAERRAIVPNGSNYYFKRLGSPDSDPMAQPAYIPVLDDPLYVQPTQTN